MIRFDEFARAHEGESRSEFLAAVTEPHLVLWTELNDESDERPTAQFLTLAHPLPSSRGGPEAADDAPRAVLPLKKRANGNAFSLMVTLGRAPNNDIVLADRRVSKFHAYFRRVGSGWTVSDANSTNGTKVDEVPVPSERSVSVRSGSRVILGGTVVLEFLEGEDLYERLSCHRPRRG